MATNHYFNHFPGDKITSEQLLVEDLVIEALKIYSIDCYYLPRESRDQIDYLLGEEALKSFPNAYVLEFYIENVMGMEGEQDIISKFGLEIRDEMRLLCSRRRFRFTIPSLKRPREGDLIYIPMMQNFYEIIHVEHENESAMYYTLGKGRDAQIYVYSLKLRQFVFSEEQIETGVEEVDEQIREAYRPVRLIMSAGGSIGTGDFDTLNTEIVYQGANLASATVTANAVAWSANTRTLDVIRVNGEFEIGKVIKGTTSNTQWTIATIDSDSPLDTMFEDIADNKELQDEANTITDWTETNPFGNP